MQPWLWKSLEAHFGLLMMPCENRDTNFRLEISAFKKKKKVSFVALPWCNSCSVRTLQLKLQQFITSFPHHFYKDVPNLIVFSVATCRRTIKGMKIMEETLHIVAYLPICMHILYPVSLFYKHISEEIFSVACFLTNHKYYKNLRKCCFLKSPGQ